MIALLLTTKNEADVLRLNIAHHLSWGVDHVAVADNESSDATQDVLREFGDAVSTEVFHDFAVRQTVRMRLLERLRARHALDWVGVSEWVSQPGGQRFAEQFRVRIKDPGRNLAVVERIVPATPAAPR